MKSENCWLRRYNEAEKWLLSRIEQLEARSSDIKLLPSVLTDNNQARDRLRDQFDGISKLSKNYHRHDNIEILEGIFEVIANPAKNEPDIVRFTDIIKVISGSMNIYVTKLLSSNAADALTVHFEVRDIDEMPMDFVVFEAPELGEQSKSCVIVFLSPLVAGSRTDTVTIVQEQKVFGIMEPLFIWRRLLGDGERSGTDRAEVRNPAWRAQVVCRACSRRWNLGTDAYLAARRDGAGWFAQPTAQSSEVRSGIKGLPPDFRVYSRMAKDVVRGEAFRVIYRTAKVK